MFFLVFMKICAIGDPHGNLDKIKKIPLSGVDLILLTGDLGSANLMRKMAFDNIEREKQGLDEVEYTSIQKKKAFMEAYISTMKTIRYLKKFAPVFTIFGNVESSNYDTMRKSKKLGISLTYLANDLNSLSGVRVINNRVANFRGIRIGGLEYFVDTIWVREFKPSDYKDSLVKAKKETSKAKRVLQWFDSLDILISHQPPYGVLDKVSAKFAPKHWQGKHAGSQAILKYLKAKSPKYVFCGHIHEGYGMKKVGKTEVYNLGVGEYKVIEIN
jgi:Icc-related predicted phosphoesterase